MSQKTYAVIGHSSYSKEMKNKIGKLATKLNSLGYKFRFSDSNTVSNIFLHRSDSENIERRKYRYLPDRLDKLKEIAAILNLTWIPNRWYPDRQIDFITPNMKRAKYGLEGELLVNSEAWLGNDNPVDYILCFHEPEVLTPRLMLLKKLAIAYNIPFIHVSSINYDKIMDTDFWAGGI